MAKGADLHNVTRSLGKDNGGCVTCPKPLHRNFGTFAISSGYRFLNCV